MLKIVYLTVRNFEFFNIRNNKKKFKRLIKKEPYSMLAMNYFC